MIIMVAAGDGLSSVNGRPDAFREVSLAISAGTAALISPTFFKRCYPLAVTDGPVRVTEPLLDVLEVLLEARDHELYGWAITKATKRSSPTVYKILERLTDYGMVDARWEDHHPDVNKPRRRFYRLTGHGAQTATQLLQERRADRRAAAGRPRPMPGWAGA
jgi:PadR family transcriptional regulator PadR